MRNRAARPATASNAPSAEFSGIVRCDTLIADSVVASSYTPGQGNVM
jgi:hypothetical protein